MAYTATLQKLAQNLKIAYNNTIYFHSGNVGDTREKEVIDYLKKVMAHKYGFSSGEAFDENDANSGQVDVIIYDNLFSTVFSDGTDKIFAPVESTYGIVSVKSKMGTGELDNAIAGIQKFNNLKRPTIEQNTIQIMPDQALSFSGSLSMTGNSFQQNINCIFAFDTTVAEKTIIQKLKDSKCVDLLVVPEKFCILGRKRKEFLLKENDGVEMEYIIIRNENSIGVFILLLQIYLSSNRLKQRDIQNLTIDIINQSTRTRFNI